MKGDFTMKSIYKKSVLTIITGCLMLSCVLAFARSNPRPILPDPVPCGNTVQPLDDGPDKDVRA